MKPRSPSTRTRGKPRVVRRYFATQTAQQQQHKKRTVGSPSLDEVIWARGATVNETRKLDRARLELAGKELGLKSLEDWYAVKRNSRDFTPTVKAALRVVTTHYEDSLPEALEDLYPEHRFERWRFVQAPKKTWSQPSNVRAFLDHVGKKLGFFSLEDYYRLTMHDLTRFGGAGLVARAHLLQQNSIGHVLKEAYPNHKWDELRFKALFSGLEGHYAFLERHATLNNIHGPEDWYKTALKTHTASGSAKQILVSYRGLPMMLATLYPTHLWLPWGFTQLKYPNSYFQETQNRRLFFEALAAELGLRHPSDLHFITLADVAKRNGTRMLDTYYNKSIYLAIVSLFPEHQFLPWKFATPPPAEFWDAPAQRLAFFDWALNDIHGESDLEKWYDTSVVDVAIRGGQGMLSRLYGGSLPSALRELYPTHSWDDNKFKKQTKRGESGVVFEEEVKFVAQALHIRDDSDWYKITTAQIVKSKVSYILARHEGLHGFLSKAFPDVTWRFEKISDIKRKSPLSKLLMTGLLQLFPSYDIIENYRDDSQRIEDFRGLQMDFYIPNLRLVVVVQDLHHYTDIAFPGQAEFVRKVNHVRRGLYSAAGMKVVVIPYWWDGSLDTLAGFINLASSNLLDASIPRTRPSTQAPSLFRQNESSPLQLKTLPRGVSLVVNTVGGYDRALVTSAKTLDETSDAGRNDAFAST